jgi:hypothetical protein
MQHLGKTMHSALYGVIIKVDHHVSTEDYVNGLFFNNLFQLEKISLGKSRYPGEDILYPQSFITFFEIAFEIMVLRRLKRPACVYSAIGSLDNLRVNIYSSYFDIPIPEKAA